MVKEGGVVVGRTLMCVVWYILVEIPSVNIVNNGTIVTNDVMFSLMHGTQSYIKH